MFADAIDAAGKQVGTTNTSGFSEDVLRINVNGPGLPFLTFVDLPGMILCKGRGQTKEDPLTLIAFLGALTDGGAREITISFQDIAQVEQNQLSANGTSNGTPPAVIAEPSESAPLTVSEWLVRYRRVPRVNLRNDVKDQISLSSKKPLFRRLPNYQNFDKILKSRHGLQMFILMEPEPSFSRYQVSRVSRELNKEDFAAEAGLVQEALDSKRIRFCSRNPWPHKRVSRAEGVYRGQKFIHRNKHGLRDISYRDQLCERREASSLAKERYVRESIEQTASEEVLFAKPLSPMRDAFTRQGM